MATLAALGSAGLMFTLGVCGAIYALIDFMFLDKKNVRSILKYSLFSFLWSFLLAASWVIFVFVL